MYAYVRKQCVAVCCSVLQRDTMRCSALQKTKIRKQNMYMRIPVEAEYDMEHCLRGGDAHSRDQV